MIKYSFYWYFDDQHPHVQNDYYNDDPGEKGFPNIAKMVSINGKSLVHVLAKVW